MATTPVNITGATTMVGFSVTPPFSTSDVYTFSFPYISQDDFEIEVNSETILDPSEYEFTSDYLIQLTATGVSNLNTLYGSLSEVPMVIRRRTTLDSRLVDFRDGATLTEADLDLASNQLFYLIQEIYDTAEIGNVEFNPIDGSIDFNDVVMLSVGYPTGETAAATLGAVWDNVITPNYTEGDTYRQYRMVIYNGDLYRANVDIDSAPATFNAANWDLVLSSVQMENITVNGTIGGTAVLDDDTFATASATTIATSESIKAYADTKMATSNIIDDDTFATASATNVPSAESVKAYADTKVDSVSGTANEITVGGTASDPVIGLADNPVIGGTDSMILPTGTTAQRVSTTAGSLRYNSDLTQFEGYSNGAWGSIGGGGGSLDYFYSEDFVATGASDFTLTGSGSVADETSAPIEGIKSIKFTQASGSLGDTLDSENITLDLNQKDTTIGFSGRYTYDGNNNEIDFVIYDVTNSQELSRVQLPAASAATTFRCLANTLSSTATIKYYFEVMTENSGAILIFDSIEGRINPLPTVETIGQSEFYSAPEQVNFWDATGDIYTFDTSLIPLTNSELLEWNDTTQTRLVAKKDCIITTTVGGVCNAGNSVAIYDSSGNNLEYASSAYTNGANTSVSGSVKLVAGDYIYYRNINANSRTGFLSFTVRPETSANVVFQGSSSGIENFTAHTHAGYGSTNTNCAEYTTVTENTISERYGTLTTDDGTYFTASVPCMVAMTVYHTRSGGASDAGIVKNGVLNTGFVSAANAAAKVSHQYQGAANETTCSSAVVMCDVGDVVAAVNDASAQSAGSRYAGIHISVYPLEQQIHSVPVANDRRASASGAGSGSTAITANTTNIDFTETSDTHNAFDGTTYTVQNSDSVITVSLDTAFTTSNTRILVLYKNGSSYKRISDGISNSTHHGHFTSYQGEFAAGDTLTIRVAGNGGTLDTSTENHHISIVEDFAPKGYFLGNLSQPVAVIKDETGGASTTGAWQTRVLDSLEDPSGIGVSIATNQFTLPAGTYYIEAFALGHGSDGNQCRIYDDDNATSVITGSGNYSDAATATAHNTPTFADGFITITTSTTFELQQRSTVAYGFGLGRSSTPFESPEYYARIKITKLR